MLLRAFKRNRPEDNEYCFGNFYTKGVAAGAGSNLRDGYERE